MLNECSVNLIYYLYYISNTVKSLTIFSIFCIVPLFYSIKRQRYYVFMGCIYTCVLIYLLYHFNAFNVNNVMYTVLPAMNQPKGNINFQKKIYNWFLYHVNCNLYCFEISVVIHTNSK